MNGINFKNITKSYDGVNNVIENFNLDINNGEFLVLLGPSGCGKSTLLRILAGLEELTSGEIFINGENINEKEIKDREIAMVFQNYALYPHMTVYKNIAINLILKKTNKKEIDEKVGKVAKTLHIENLLNRKPRQLSGGQMQRVALARAMIRNPKVFLMDEPLSNLDAKLRVQIRSEIIKLYRELKTTTIYVTHDQIEAMTMATTIVLMNEGKIMQKGTPDQLYNKPINLFVASFIGSPQMNFLRLNKNNEKILSDLLNKENSIKFNIDIENTIIGIRPEHIVLKNGNSFIVELVENLGNEKLITLKIPNDKTANIDTLNNNEEFNSNIYINDNELIVRANSEVNVGIGDYCDISVNSSKFHFFDKNTKNRLYK